MIATSVPLLPALSFLALGLGLLYAGAEFLVRGSSSLATRLGVNPLIVGITVIAYGTSMPEMVVSIQASLQGNGDVAVGNIVGSNLCTIGIVLGLAVLVRPPSIQLNLVRWHVPLMIFGTCLLAAFLYDTHLTRIEGLVLFTGIMGYTWANIRQVQRDRNLAAQRNPGGQAPVMAGTLAGDLGFALTGLVLLILGGRWLIYGAVGAARIWGVSEAIIGLTLVAIGTSLPDLIASLMAAWKNQPDLAVGNAIGSVLFNLFNAIGVAALVRPIHAPALDRLDLVAMVLMAILVLPLMKSGLILKRWEGALFLFVYLLYLGWRIAL